MKTILLIEDNDDIREDTSELLEMEGYQVLIADNGKTGLALAKEHTPDLILCDVMMPEANGYEVLRGLKKDQATSEIPFIFLTSNDENIDIKTGLDRGAQGYIQKPFEPEELFKEIADCLFIHK